MEIVSQTGGCRTGHQISVTLIEHLTTDGIGEIERQVESLEVHTGTKTTVDIWSWIATVIVCRIIISGGGRSIALFVGHIPHRLSILCHTCILWHTPGVHWQTLTIEVEFTYISAMTIQCTVDIVWIQRNDFIAIMSGIEIDVPHQVLGTDGIIREGKFHTLVYHITYIVIDTIIAV